LLVGFVFVWIELGGKYLLCSQFVFFVVTGFTASKPRSMVVWSDPGKIRGQGEEDIQEGTVY
jgi:hypothetical protein